MREVNLRLNIEIMGRRFILTTNLISVFLQPGGKPNHGASIGIRFKRSVRHRQANLEAAINLHVAKGELRLGVAVTGNQPQAAVTIFTKGKELMRFNRDLSPAIPFVEKNQAVGKCRRNRILQILR